MTESPKDHEKCKEEVSELWDEIEKREKKEHSEGHDEEDKDHEEQILSEE